MRGHDCQLTGELSLGNQRLFAPHPSNVECTVLSTASTVGTIFKDAALRESGVVEIEWIEYVTELC